MKKRFTILMAACVMLLTIIGLPCKVVGQEKTDELAYTIEFKDNGTSNDGSNVVSSIADVIASGSNYVNTISCTKVYQAKSGHGIKLGSSGNKGSIQLNFTTTGSYIGAIAATKIKINIKLYDTGKKVKVYINGSNTATELSPTTSFADYEISVNTTITSVKIEASNSSSNRFYIKDLKVYRTAAPAYTITAQSNNTNYGTVSLSGSVITGSPNSGYRYADPAYTISPANSATVSQNGNAFTVTPSANTTITINFEPIPTYTVTLNDNGAQLTEASAGAGVTLPLRPAIGDYTFAGWSIANVPTETTTAPTIIPAGTYHPTSNIALYPVYTRTVSGGGTTDVPVSTTIAAYASANSWINSQQYTSITLDENVTITGKDNGNNSKYYSSTPGTWRHYATDAGEITVTTSSGTLKDVTITYSGNTLTYSDSDVTSGDAITVSGTSAVFAVSGSSSNTQVSAIDVTYTVSGSSTTYYWSSPTPPAVATPVITAGANPFYFSTTATITCTTEGAAIKYSDDNENWSNYSSPLSITETKTVYAKAIKDANESSVASLEFTKNLAEPTVTVSGDLTLDLDGETSVAAGTLSAAVTYYDEPVEGATVTWSSSDTDIAEINASGAVTIKAVGEVTFTATYAGNSDYAEATGTKTVTVTNSKAPGTVTNPYTVAQARAAIDANSGVTNVYATGIVSQIVTPYSSQHGNITYNVSTDGATNSNQLQIYRGTCSGEDEVRVGDVVVVRGNLTKYSSTYEFSAGSTLVSLKLVAPTFDPEAGAVESDRAITISDNHTGATIYYTTDGATPTTSSTPYDSNNKPTIDAAKTIKAIAVKTGYTTSDVASAEYTILTPAATPTISVATGTYNYVLSVEISTTTDGATIYYTTNGTSPTTSSTAYTGAITVDETMTIKAIAYKSDMAISGVASATYTMNIPVVNAENVNLACEATSGSIVYTITNGVEGGAVTAAAITASEPANWLTVVGSNPFTSPIGLTCTANTTSSDRSATVTLTYTYNANNTNKTVTKDVTVTQSKVDYTELPFSWAGGTKEVLTALTGVAGHGLGSNYAETNAPYRVKFDTEGDYILVKTDSQPAIVTIGVKMLGGAETSYIIVQCSTDGETFDDGESLEISGDKDDELTLTSTRTFNENVRYVKLYFNKGSNVGVGPITIAKQISGAVSYTDLIISANETYIVSNGGILTVTGTLENTDPANLIIEDGGQLILKDGDDDVAATVKKNITAPTSWTQNDKTGWYAISSTVGTISDITSVSNFANQTFDLYKYVESSNVGYGWINYNNPAQTSTFGGLVNGQGYLYARQNGATVSFTGNVNHTDVELTGLTANNTANENLRGIHLIGNPYTHNIYKGVALTATKGAMSSTYYRLDGNNLWVVESDDNPIGPGQGFLVKVTDGTDLTFTNNASAPGSSKANNDYIRFAVSNSEYEDATFALFQKGEGLRKINHRNTEAPMIYISQNDANYASATMDDDTKSFNLNFEAKTMGQYKLSYKVNGEFNYLHVIDRATGEDIDMLLEGSYSFIGSPMDNPSRFIVRLGYLPNYDDNGQDIFAYQNGNDIVVSGEGELQIFDVMGRKVSTMNIYGIETVNGLAQGVYIFRLEGKTQKIVVR